jgi:hypothetical protein
MTDIGSQSQWSSLAAQNVDLGYTSGSRGSSPPTVPGSLPVTMIQGDTSKREFSLPEDYGGSTPSTPPDLADGTLGGLGHAAEYFVFPASFQGLRNLTPSPRDTLLAIGKTRISPSNVWPSLGKFAHVGRNRLLTAVVAT